MLHYKHERIGQNHRFRMGFVSCPVSSPLLKFIEVAHEDGRSELHTIHTEVSMKRLSGVMVLVAFLSVSVMPTLSFAGDPAPAEQKDKGGHVVFGDDKKDEKKEMGGK